MAISTKEVSNNDCKSSSADNKKIKTQNNYGNQFKRTTFFSK